MQGKVPELKQWQAAWAKGALYKKTASRICRLRLAMRTPLFQLGYRFNSGTVPCMHTVRNYTHIDEGSVDVVVLCLLKHDTWGIVYKRGMKYKPMKFSGIKFQNEQNWTKCIKKQEFQKNSKKNSEKNSKKNSKKIQNGIMKKNIDEAKVLEHYFEFCWWLKLKKIKSTV